MTDRGLHLIEEDLGEGWVTEWIDQTLSEIEAFLARHAAFDAYLESRE